MSKDNIISHDGIVLNVEENVVFVRIITKSACFSCKSNGACPVSEISEKIIEVSTDQILEKGNHVQVEMEEKIGWLALFYSIILPFIVMMFTLFSVHAYSNSDAISGITAIIALGPYYLLLHLFRKKIEKRITFKARKIVK